MKIKTKLLLIAGFSALVIVVLGVFLYISLQSFDEKIRESGIANQIVNDVFDSNLLMDEYLLRNENSIREQWFAMNNQITVFIKSNSGIFGESEEKEIIEKIIEKIDANRETFSELVAIQKGSDRNDVEATKTEKERQVALISALIAENRETISFANQLEAIVSQEAADGQKVISYILAGFITALFLFVAIVLYFIWISIVKPLIVLKETAVRIAALDFSTPISTASDDELGELSIAFNQMMAKLKETYTSLENAEVASRNVLEDLRVEKEALRRSEERLRLEVMRMPIGYIVWDKNFRAVTWNPAAEKIFGFTAGEAIGKHPYDFIVPKSVQPQIDNIWHRLLTGDISANSVNENTTKDGSTIICEWNNTPLKQPDGTVLGVMSMVHDVTKEREAFEANEKLAAIVRDTDEAIISTGLDTKILSWNGGAERMYGYKENEVIGKDVKDAIVPKDKRQEVGEILDRVKNGERIENYETERIKKSGKIFEVSVTLSPIRDNEGKIFAISVIYHDITKAKEIEKAKNDFLSLASHQLRTPLSGIRWLIETLMRGVLGKLNNKQKEYVDEIHKTNNRMIELVSSMLDTLKLESGQVFNLKEKIVISKLSEDIISMLGAAAKRKKIVLLDGLKGHDDIAILSNFQAVKNILESFVTNAINYSHAEGKIEFGIKDERREAVFFVKDHGIGIPEEEKKHIFERFFRGYNAKAMKPAGTGLGLSLSALIADKIGGKVSFESEEGKGSTFYLRLPKKSV